MTIGAVDAPSVPARVILPSRTASPAIADWLTITIFATLPTVGLIAGPAYAALVFGLAGTQLIVGVVVWRRWPPIDPPLALIAATFAAWCWASVAWSVEPGRSAQAALQMTAILAATLLVLAMPPPSETARTTLFTVIACAAIVGTAVFITDSLLHYRLQEVLLARQPPFVGTKYSRGLSHLMLLIWPVFAFLLARRAWRLSLALLLCLVVSLVLSVSLAARAAAAAGLLVLLLAMALPRLVARLLAGAMVLLTVALPLGLHALSDRRPTLAPYLKYSGLHRLEIWDYMNLHVMARPMLGWGVATASRLPDNAEALSRYTILHDGGIYPHNQWLELWVETGAVGAAVGLGFALLALSRIRRLDPRMQPFAYAAFTAAVVVSFVNFEFLTDSWWAAVAATGYLLSHASIPADRT